MPISKPLVLTLSLAFAQAWLPQTACDRRRPPAPPGDPWANIPITETFTTADGARLGVQVLVGGLQIPWGMAFAPDGRLFISERPGRIRVVQNGQLLAQPAITVPDVRVRGEAGLLGIALHPDFAQNHYLYAAYASRSAGGALITRLARFREINNTLVEQVVLVDNIQGEDGHAGSRVRFGPDGKIYFTTGDAKIAALAQTLSSLAGKILRVNEDGTTPLDNPYGSPVWTWGHRHPQGIDWHPVTGQLWGSEHGNTGQDELNLLVRGDNYGWPVIRGGATRPGMVRPVLFYTPAIAPAGLSFYNATRIPQFLNNIFFATLRGEHLHRIVLDPSDPSRPVAEERLLEGRFGRLRDVITGPDGALYFCTSNRDGLGNGTDDRIARIIPVQ